MHLFVYRGVVACRPLLEGEINSFEKKIALCPSCGGAGCGSCAVVSDRLQVAGRWRCDGHRGWPEDLSLRHRQVLRKPGCLGPAAAERRTSYDPAPEYSAPADRRRDPDAPGRETRPARHR